VQVIATPVLTTADIEPALASFARAPNGGLILLGSSFTALHHTLIADLASRYRLPSIGAGPNFAKDGGLMDYGPNPDLVSQFRQAATYVDRIFKGEKPSDLPIQAPVKYTFVINLKTAKALGVTIPETLLATADEVIQ
jgi:putative ABC transport system substrate-binding protein